MIYVAGAVLFLGAVMYTRGWIYTIWPDGKIAEKRKRRNLKVGFPTDMKLFGRKIRRLGFMLLLAGGGLLGFDLSRDDTTATDGAAVVAPAEAAPDAP